MNGSTFVTASIYNVEQELVKGYGLLKDRLGTKGQLPQVKNQLDLIAVLYSLLVAL